MPSENQLAKQELVKSLGSKFSQTQACVVTECTGISVEKITALRAKLREAEVEFRVIKNSLAIRALEGTPLEGLKDVFHGPTAVGITQKDPVTLAKILKEFSQQEKKFLIRAGVLDGNVLTKEQVWALANVPSREVLLARLVGSLQSPYSGFVVSLSGILRKFVYALDAVRRKKEE